MMETVTSYDVGYGWEMSIIDVTGNYEICEIQFAHINYIYTYMILNVLWNMVVFHILRNYMRKHIFI